MQMYVHYYERELMNEGDNPPIGIVLCADKSESVVKYTLPENETQIFASKYKLYLPSEDELLRELNREYQALKSNLLKSLSPTSFIIFPQFIIPLHPNPHPASSNKHKEKRLHLQ